MATKPEPSSKSIWQRVFSLPNVAAVGGGVLTFLVAIRIWPTNRGAILAGVLAGVTASLVWLLIERFGGLRPIDTLFDVPHLGTIPKTPRLPVPALTAPTSPAAQEYDRTARRLEAATQGRVVLVSSLRDGDGATTVALNLATAATMAGRNVLLVDADLDNNRLSRFGSTGISPGLVELTNGDADLNQAARLWSIDESNRFPFIPSGSANGDRPNARAVDRILGPLSEHADLVLIDTPSGAGDIANLGPVADGAVLVVPQKANPADVAAAAQRTSAVGAPPVGYVVNEAAHAGDSAHQHPFLRSLKRAITTTIGVLLAFTIFNGAQLVNLWANVDRQPFDLEGAQEILELPDEPIADPLIDEENQAAITAVPTSSEEFRSVLIVGSDESGQLADVIIMALLPGGDGEPVMISMPRDLYLPNRCTQTYTKINAALNGCGEEVTGPTLLALSVTDFTGVAVDNIALFTFDGFEAIVDAVGGIEICVDYAVRDWRAELNLPVGCTQATGAQALSWVRSRHTEELVDGRWRTVDSVSDLTRNQRQQDVVLTMFSKLNEFSSPADLTATVRSLTDAFSLDESLGITDAIALAWELRGIDPTTVTTIEIPVVNKRTEDGAAVLIPTVPFNELLDEAFPGRDPVAPE